tara:strand:+ start:696 stop:1496 length:801 start_codon:yes stop_codon:yes gene_type:complete
MYFKKYIFINCFKKLKKYTFIRFFFNPSRIFWLIKVKLLNKRIPLKTLPSFEHRHILKIDPFPDNIIDVGFNKGQFSSLILIFKKKVSIYAFDPNVGETIFIANKIKNSYPQRFEFFNFALGDVIESKFLNLAVSSDNNSFMKPTIENEDLYSKVLLTGKKSKVLIKTLSSVNFKLNSSNNLLKIDVQGFELKVLKGISNKLYKKIKWIYIEVSEIKMYKGQGSLKMIDDFLRENGFFLEKKFNIVRSSYDKKIIYCDSLYKKVNV